MGILVNLQPCYHMLTVLKLIWPGKYSFLFYISLESVEGCKTAGMQGSRLSLPIDWLQGQHLQTTQVNPTSVHYIVWQTCAILVWELPLTTEDLETEWLIGAVEDKEKH